MFFFKEKNNDDDYEDDNLLKTGTQARAKGHFRFVTAQPKTNESAPSTSTSADLLSNQSKFGPVEFNPYRQAYVNANLHPHHFAVLPVQQMQNY